MVYFLTFFIVGVQNRNVFARDRTKNPFSLYKFNSIQMYLNGQEHFPKTIKRTDNDYSEMYNTFLYESGRLNEGDTVLNSYYQVYQAMCFDLTQDHSQNQHGVNLIKSGTVNLTIGFENAAAANLVLMVLAYYEQIIEISKDHEISVI